MQGHVYLSPGKVKDTRGLATASLSFTFTELLPTSGSDARMNAILNISISNVLLVLLWLSSRTIESVDMIIDSLT